MLCFGVLENPRKNHLASSLSLSDLIMEKVSIGAHVSLTPGPKPSWLPLKPSGPSAGHPQLKRSPVGAEGARCVSPSTYGRRGWCSIYSSYFNFPLK